MKPVKENVVTIEIDVGDGPSGLIVDGQQRVSALANGNGGGYDVFRSHHHTGS